MKNAPFAFALLVLAAALFLGAPGRAASDSDRPIAYAAKYYNPPPSKARSYSHLYRINPDGTRRLQLTSGAFDDYRPLWSGDGKQIVFLRDQEKTVAGKETLSIMVCLVGARGGKVTTLAAMKDGTPTVAFSPTAPALLALSLWRAEGVPDGGQGVVRLINTQTGRIVKSIPGSSHLEWSPDGKRLLLNRGEGDSKPSGVFNVATGVETPIADKLSDAACWAGPNRIIAKPDGDGAGGELLVINPETGVLSSRLTVAPTPETRKRFESDSVELTYFFSLSPLPGAPDAVLYGAIAGESTSGKWLYQYRVDLNTGLLTFWGETGDLRYSPDRKRFCTILGRDLADYGKKNGRVLSVWVRPLLIGKTETPTKQKPLVSGLVIVNGVDWRP